jgi:hypothetical protein
VLCVGSTVAEFRPKPLLFEQTRGIHTLSFELY